MEQMLLFDQVAALARKQHGVVSREQLAGLGVTRSLVQSWHRMKRFERLSQRVWIMAGAPETREQFALAAVLDANPGAALSHHSSANWWEMVGYALSPLQAIVPYRGHAQRNYVAILHRSRTLVDDHVMRVHDVPVTTPARTLFDLASEVGRDQLERTMERALAASIVKMPQLYHVLADVSVQGFNGVVLMRELIEARGRGYRPASTGLELRVREIAQRHNLPELEPQVHVYDEAGWITIADFAHRQTNLIVEADSDRFHAGLFDRAKDDRITQRPRAAGYTVLRFSQSQIWHRPIEVASALAHHFWVAKRVQ